MMLKKRIRKLAIKYKEIFLYILFGLGTTIVNWGSYTVFIKLVMDKVTAANIFSWICATLFAYITNKLWVFNSQTDSLAGLAGELLMFVLARLGTGAFEMLSVPVLVAFGFEQGVAGIRGLYAKITVSILVVFANYFISKLMIFRKRQK